MVSTARNAATAAALVVPFHCVICFDEFDRDEHIPMVLPCGHTYVCEICSKRLKKCMECRRPLFLNTSIKSIPSETTSAQSSRVARRSPVSPVRRKPAQQVESIPLPISKNLLMIAIIEATQQNVYIDDQDGIDEDERDTEANKILDGIEALVGPCGTYVVKEEDGLVVLPTDPRIRNHRRIPAPESCREPFHLEKGQTVQIVESDDGVFKLARDDGYIMAGCSQFVKVNGPLESSCRLEGMYNLVEARKHDLKNRLEQIERLSDGLAQRIECVRKEDPSHPIITDPPPKEENLNQNATHNESDSDDSKGSNNTPKLPVVSPLGGQCEGSPTTHFSNTVRKLELLDTPSRAISSPDHPNRDTRTPNTIDNSDIREYADENITPAGRHETPYMCATFQFFDDEDKGMGIGDWRNNRSFEDCLKVNPQSSPRQGPSNTFPSSLNNVSGFQDVSPYNNHHTGGPIDFSTGMSGHGALTSSKKNGKVMAQREVRMMGAHAGLSVFKRKKRLRNFYSPQR